MTAAARTPLLDQAAEEAIVDALHPERVVAAIKAAPGFRGETGYGAGMERAARIVEDAL